MLKLSLYISLFIIALAALCLGTATLSPISTLIVAGVIWACVAWQFSVLFGRFCKIGKGS